MDDGRFDLLARMLAGVRSRRGTAKLMGSGALTALGLSKLEEDAAGKGKGK